MHWDCKRSGGCFGRSKLIVQTLVEKVSTFVGDFGRELSCKRATRL